MGSPRVPKLHDRDWLYEQYVHKQRTYEQIADELGCYLTSVAVAVKRHNIPARNRWACTNSRPTMLPAIEELARRLKHRHDVGYDPARQLRAIAEAQQAGDDDAERAALIDLAVMATAAAERLDRTPNRLDNFTPAQAAA
jgi:hypothetical protein